MIMTAIIYNNYYDHLHSAKDNIKNMTKISNVIEDVVNWEKLAGLLNIDSDKVQEDCKMEPSCYRRKLVKKYHDQTDKSPQQVAEDVARVLEDEMENKKVSNKLRKLSFGEL